MKKRYTVLFLKDSHKFHSAKLTMSINFGEKVMSEKCGFLILSFDIPVELHDPTPWRVYGTNTK